MFYSTTLHSIPPAQQRAIAIRTAIGHGAVSCVAAGTGYSVQHVSRILTGHRPQPFVLAWALGRAALPVDDALDLPAAAPKGFRAAVRQAYRAGTRARPVDAPGLWERWKHSLLRWPVTATNTMPHLARRHQMGRGGGTSARAHRPPQNTARTSRAQAIATPEGGNAT